VWTTARTLVQCLTMATATKTARASGVQTFVGLLDHENEGSGSTGFIEVPAEVVNEIGQGKKRPPVRALINGFELRTTIAVYGGKYYIPARNEVRDAAKITHGDRVTIEMSLDVAPREVDLPDDLSAAFKRDKTAQAAFDKLSFSHKKEYVQWIVEAKREETRTARVEKTLTMLKEGNKGPKA
jgi:hypothetical protein